MGLRMGMNALYGRIYLLKLVSDLQIIRRFADLVEDIDT
jgi:hypothetical protein